MELGSSPLTHHTELQLRLLIWDARVGSRVQQNPNHTTNPGLVRFCRSLLVFCIVCWYDSRLYQQLRLAWCTSMPVWSLQLLDRIDGDTTPLNMAFHGLVAHVHRLAQMDSAHWKVV